MRIAVLGTGVVGSALGTRLVQTGHEVRMGSRTAGNDKARAWVAAAGPAASEGTFADAAAYGEVVVNATGGLVSLDALTAAGADNLAGKVLLDIANPLDFSGGFPPTLSVKDTDSLGEQIQAAFPEARVVKALNTLTAELMVHPERVGGGQHTVFVSGNDPAAKATVIGLLEEFGHTDVIDLGDISTCRGTEMFLPLWLRIMGSLGTPMFNVKVVRP